MTDMTIQERINELRSLARFDDAVTINKHLDDIKAEIARLKTENTLLEGHVKVRDITIEEISVENAGNLLSQKRMKRMKNHRWTDL